MKMLITILRCPYDKYDSCQLPGSCEDQYSACWWKYFISKIKTEGSTGKPGEGNGKP